MRLRISGIVWLLALFLPFEVIAFKYLPVSDTVYSYLRFVIELAIYLIAGFVFARYLYKKKMPHGTPVDKPLLIFIAYAIGITIINNAPALQSFVGLRSLLRYVPLFYVIAFVNFDRKQSKSIVYGLLAVTAIQCGIAIYQHYMGISSFWYPRAGDLEIGGKQLGYKLLNTGFGGGREMGAGIGTFGDSVLLAIFLVILFIITLSALHQRELVEGKKRIYWISLMVLIVVALFFTYSRGSVLIAMTSIPVVIFLSGGKKKLVIYLTAAILLIAPMVLFGVFDTPASSTAYVNPKVRYTDPLANFTSIFTSSYINTTLEVSRGAVLTEVGGELIRSFTLLGYSPAQDFALEKAATRLFGSNMPVNNLPVINDVYWVAFIIYYGLMGLSIYFFILYKIFTVSRSVVKNTPDPLFRGLAVAMAALVIISIPYSLIVRTFVFRSFGLYFWLLAGLVFAEWQRLRNDKGEREFIHQ